MKEMKYGNMVDNNWREAGFRHLEYTEFKRLLGHRQLNSLKLAWQEHK